tara:strand:+ start:2544 stop:2741 length:198 start_codon:yes stop_codon:yes gene_type:complete
MDAFGTGTIATSSGGPRHILTSGTTNSTTMLRGIKEIRWFFQKRGELGSYGSALSGAEIAWISKM